jgi:hypothetical protein
MSRLLHEAIVAMHGSFPKLSSPRLIVHTKTHTTPPKRWRRAVIALALAGVVLLIMQHFGHLGSNISGMQRVYGMVATRPNKGHEGVAETSKMNEMEPSTRPVDDTTSSAAPVAATKPTAEGSTSKIIVMGKMTSEDTSWVLELPEWKNAVYVVDTNGSASPTGLRTAINKGHEAMPYLTYIVDNYPNFPDVIAFVHAHRDGWPTAWHTDTKDHSAVLMLQTLRTDTVIKHGYVNLRCNLEVGCPAEVQPFRENADEKQKAQDRTFLDVYGSLFNRTLQEMRQEIQVVASPCCAQFAVSAQQVLARPKSDYDRYLRYLEETEYDDYTIGRVLEYIWHMIFGRKPLHCPDPAQCYCDVYGKCSGALRGDGGGKA